MMRLNRPTATFRFASGMVAGLPFAILVVLAGGCSGSPEAGSTAKFDPGKEAEQQKVADQHAATLQKEREYMTNHMPAGTPTGPPPAAKGK